MLNRVTKKRNACWSLLAVWMVLLVCWGQPLLAMQTCPLSTQALVALDQGLISVPDSIEAPPSVEHSSESSLAESSDQSHCELTQQLLQASVYTADMALPTCLLLLWLLTVFVRQGCAPWRASEPIGAPRRRHLIYCVFRE